MVITNNYRKRTWSEEWKEEGACAVDWSRAGRAANKLPEPLSGISRVCRRHGVVGFDFHSPSSSPEKASSKGTRDTCRRAKVTARSRRGGRIAARCVKGLRSAVSLTARRVCCSRCRDVSPRSRRGVVAATLSSALSAKKQVLAACKTLASQLTADNRRRRPVRQTGGCPVPWTDVLRL